MHARGAPHTALTARFLAAGVLVGGLSVPAIARAQTVSQSAQPYPARLINGVVQNVRPENLNPQGINYADCASDMMLQYNVLISGFSDQTVEVWVSTSGDCTQDGNRGNNGIANCWLVARTQPQRAVTSAPLQLTVPVRAIVGPQSQTTFSAGLVTDMGVSACSAQATSAAVQFTVFILPIQSPSHYVGQGFMQMITADTVGPPAPAINGPSIGDTFITASWTPNGDPDTVGYDVFFERVGSTTAIDASTVVCKEAGSPTSMQQDSGAEDAAGPTDATTTSDADDGAAISTDAAAQDAADGAVSSPTDAATAADALSQASTCINVGPSSTAASSACMSSVLSSAIASDSGTITPSSTTTTTEDGAIVVEDSGVIAAGPGGVSTIDCKFLIGGNCPAGQPAYTSTNVTLSGQANNSFNITGLTDGVTYNYTVTAVDGFGNPGPPAEVQCGQPAKVNDFFTVFRQDGGHAGGGFCALDVVGERSETSLGLVGLGLGAALYARRKRSRRG